jgi:hypothetical protein
MKSNLGFSIAIFPVYVFWQHKLFKRCRLGVFTKTEHIFAQDDFSRTKPIRHYTKKHWYINGPLHQLRNTDNKLYIIAKQLHLGLTYRHLTKNLPSFMIFVEVFPCFLVYFSLFSSVLNKIPQSCWKLRVSGR